jgi:FtsZ-interacting cell division protein ZipA
LCSLQVEELQRTKPAAPQAATSSSSILDFGFINSSSNSNSHPSSNNSSPALKFDAFTKKFKDTMVELINTDLSQPLPNSSMHSPSSHYAMHQQPISSPTQQQQQPQQQPSPAKQGQQQAQQQQQQQQKSPSLSRQSVQAGSTTASAGGAEQRSASPAGGSSSTAAQASGFSMTHEGMQYQMQGEQHSCRTAHLI